MLDACLRAETLIMQNTPHRTMWDMLRVVCLEQYENVHVPYRLNKGSLFMWVLTAHEAMNSVFITHLLEYH